jgi:hypothetical protein
MASRPDRLQWLTQQFNDLSASLSHAASSEERVELLRRMKAVIDEIDALIFSSLRIEKQAKSLPNDQSKDAI